MKRFVRLVPFFAVSVCLGCAGGEEKKTAPTATVEKKERPKKGGKVEELTAPTDGVFKGRVVLDGPTPKIEAIMAMATHNDKETCLAGDEFEKNTQTWILAPDKKGVANVVVKLLPGPGKKFKSIEPTEKVVEIDQPHCAFVPHVVAVKPGQKLLVKNSAPISHNTSTAVDPTVNESKNVQIAPGKDLTLELNPQRDPVTLSCTAHSWMTAKVFVNDSPYIAVTKADGTFEIPNVPTGVELVVVGIHEAGEVDGGKDGQKMTFKPGSNEMELKVKPR